MSVSNQHVNLWKSYVSRFCSCPYWDNPCSDLLLFISLPFTLHLLLPIPCIADPFFVCTSKNGVRCFDNKIVTAETNCSKTLFRGYSDICLPGEEPIRFSKVLGGLLAQRQIPTYSDAVWYPFLKKNPITLPAKKYNLFQGFALEQVPSNDIEFEKSQLYDLIVKLSGGNPNHSTIC